MRSDFIDIDQFGTGRAGYGCLIITRAATDFHREEEFNGAMLDSQDDMSVLEDYLFSLTSASRQGSRREKLAVIHQADLSAARSGSLHGRVTCRRI